MQCYTELTPPTAVTHSLNLPFTSANANNLVVAKTSLLQIFTAKIISIEIESQQDAQKQSEKWDPTVNSGDGLEASFIGGDSLLRPDRARRTKLVLVAEYTLSGTVTSLARIKTVSSKSGGEALLIGFRDAKLSLVEWDPTRPGISTISIHFYEQDDLQRSPWAPSLKECVNQLTADPKSRCAALKFGGRNLAIIPFKQDDEDVNMDDWDEDIDGPRPADQTVSKAMNGIKGKEETPYNSSFVLRLAALDPNLINPIHLAFLYEYREPTFGILSSTQMPASSLLFERKDHMTYMVFTLDLHQKASTTILSVNNLPYDLSEVIPLPAPVGGALLLGVNELIHIDQAGKANGVAVNVYAKQCTSFSLVDQSDLEMRLEGSKIEQLSIQSGEMIIILRSGEMAILSFHMDGRSVSGLSIRRVSAEAGGLVIPAAISSISPFTQNTVFLGSETSDSLVLGWSRKSNQLSRRKSRVEIVEDADDDLLDELDDEDDDDADDDLYGEGPSATQASTNGIAKSETVNSKAGDYVFHIHDSLVNIAPIVDIAFGKASFFARDEEKADSEGVTGDLELVAAVGKQKAGALAVLHRNIQPKVIGRFEFPEARGIWTMSAKRPTEKGLEVKKEKSAMSGDYATDAQYDRFMIVSKALADGTETSDVYALTSANFEALAGTEFEPAAGSTIEAGTLGNGMRVIQVLKSEVRSYDGDLGLAQILPMYDEDTGAEPQIVSASFADPFLLLFRDDASIFVAQCDDNNELEEIEREDDALLATKWLTGCLYTDTTGIFAAGQSDKGHASGESVMMFLLSSTGALHIYSLPNLSKAVYVAEGLCFVPPVLSADYAARRSAARETITELIVADLGDEISKSPYLILRPSTDDLTIYEPFRTTSESTSSLSSSLQFLKIHNPHLAHSPDVSAVETQDEVGGNRNEPMRVISDLGGYSTVFLPGGSPSFVLKTAKSTPKVLSLQGLGVRGMSSFHTEGCDRGFIYTDLDGIARVSQFPQDTIFAELGVSLQKVQLGEEVHGVAYHPTSECYVAATSTLVDFELPKEEDHHHPNWAKEEITFKPTMEQSHLKLINPVNWSVIHEIELDPFEIIMCTKTLNLEVSEITNERKQCVVVGTGISKGEDLAIKGRIHVFDIVSVVPEPDRPETNKRLKLIAREEIARGAITCISEIGTQGFMLVSQGQKCMVRGLKEDGTLLPVAFMDMNCYVTSIKELRGSGICVFADAIKGVWVAGYTEEPYKMMLFGKSAKNMEIMEADLLPDGKELYVVAADSDCNLHIMQFDPEHPKSLQGHLLLHRSTFALGGHLPTSMTVLPRTKAATLLPPTPEATEIAAEDTIPEHEILMTSSTGCISLLSPLSEEQYRRLSTLSSHLINTLYHACGLNPRAYRIDKDAPEGMVGSRTIIDGTILMRWMELGSQRRAEVAGRVGVDVEEVRDDLAALMGGLGYL
ncbi:CPSF A subunit region-domain-containing protein [Cadophora sp. MPI-SDFR-AT-0126]|nr:CPSF A subunit region-domain-containing protein [Leotiomycetes sp. MPI-SDFR-AT-0126]